MNPSNYRCLDCHSQNWRTYTTFWLCEGCARQYPCVGGIPRLYGEDRLGKQDKALRDFFYNGLLGRFYQQVMPFLALPVRPRYRSGLAVYFVLVGGLIALGAFIGWRAVQLARGSAFSAGDAVALVLAALLILFLNRHRYLLHLLLLAVPVKLALRRTAFRPRISFSEVHEALIAQLQQRPGTLQILDVSTGTCNSLYRHGWMTLEAEFTGLDLSETMLLQGRDLMAERRVPMDFVLADALELPFRDQSFDVVLNYGALNGYSDAGRALAEMARVAKPGGIVLVLDEQLYEQASAVERKYFMRVLSNHNICHSFPADAVPPELSGEIHQVYHFYYLYVGTKK